ncbi:MAG TPA: carboxymuconolactone decarboxylase family protein [Burkholderiales bacterium]
MARVRDVGPEELPPQVREVYERFAGGYGAFRDQVGVFAHVPSSVAHLMAMLLELREQKNVPYRYVELAVVAVSKLNECHYCVGQHKPLLAIEGISPGGAERVLDYGTNPELDEVDRLVVEYSIAVTNAPQRIHDEIFERLRRHFSEAQIVELTLRIALCGFFNRFNDALQIEREPHDH